MSGYHVTQIKKSGILSPYKLVEETIEFVDALASGNKIMALVELSDLYGMVKLMANQLDATIEDIAIMSNTTTNAFSDNTRQSFGSAEDWLRWIVTTASDYTTHRAWTSFSVLGDFYIVYTADSYAPAVNTGALPANRTYIIEPLIGSITSGGNIIEPGQLRHHRNQIVSCPKGTIIRISSTMIAGLGTLSKIHQNEFNTLVSNLKETLKVD